jgi:hypothetical protein
VIRGDLWPAHHETPGGLSGRRRIHLSHDVLDRIDAIVAPGRTVDLADNMWSTSTTALDPASRRR